MKNGKFKKFILNPWTISIGTAFISVIITMICDAVKDAPILSTIGAILVWIWNAIISFLTFDLKVWWVLVAIVVLIMLLFVIAKISDSKKITPPPFTTYKRDKIGSWNWSWNWEFSTYYKKWHVKDLQAHCPECDTPMFHDEYDTKFKCPRCNYETSYHTEFKKRIEVEAIIIDNIHKKEQKENGK